MIEAWQRASGVVGQRHLLLATTAVVIVVAVAAVLLWWSRRARRAGAGAAVQRAHADVSERPRASRAARLRSGLAKTRSGLMTRLAPLLGRATLDAEQLEALENALLAADVGVRMTTRLLECVRPQNLGEPVRAALEREIVRILEDVPQPAGMAETKPHVIMVVGVNGVGKTTSIGKLAHRYCRQGAKTLLVAGDTFRAAAIEQLTVWAERAGADVVRHQQGGDPGAVVYDGIRAAVARHADVVIVDTAGRLHTKSNLMEELRKVRRILAREVSGAPHETLLVLDAVTGQNGVAQARAFLEQLEVSGVILTKLDGTAKGGVVIAIAGELGIPVRLVGVGEGIDDLKDFDPREFAAALLGNAEGDDSLDSGRASPVSSQNY